MKKIIHNLKQWPLFYAAIAAVIVETLEIVHNSCGIWQQELSLLLILGILGLIKVKNKLFLWLAAAIVIVFYIFEFKDQFFEMEVCGIGANQLNPLLLAVIIASIGIYYNARKENLEK